MRSPPGPEPAREPHESLQLAHFDGGQAVPFAGIADDISVVVPAVCSGPRRGAGHFVKPRLGRKPSQAGSRRLYSSGMPRLHVTPTGRDAGQGLALKVRPTEPFGSSSRSLFSMVSH